VFIDWPEQISDSDSAWGTVLTDILRHLPASYGEYYRDPAPMTSGHETTHGINSHLRNYENDTGTRANGFYVLEDRGVIVVEPSIRKSDVNGGSVGVDLVTSGLWSYESSDGVSGSLEFTIYGLALGLAVEELDPTYFAAQTQFREFMAWNAERAMDTFYAGRDMEPFGWFDEQTELYDCFTGNTAAADLRDFALRTFGADFCLEVFGF